MEVNQQCAEKQMDKTIPRNQDKGEQKDRVRILGIAVLANLLELKSKDDAPVFVVSAKNLANVPGVIKNNVQAEPAVTSRLDNIEKLMEKLAKGMSEMNNTRKEQWPLPSVQVNGTPLQDGAAGGTGVGGQQQPGGFPFGGARSRNGNTLPIGGLGLRDRGNSQDRKRKSAELEQQQYQQQQQQLRHQQQQQQNQTQEPGQHGQPGWNNVVRRRKPVQYGTSQVKVTGGEASPYDVFVGNTHPESTMEIVKEVLLKVSESMPDELKLSEQLEILEVECLTKPRTDGRPIWNKNWRVRVANRFRVHMLRPESYPAGWSSRRYFPARTARTPAAPLYPDQQEPAAKKPNHGSEQSGDPSPSMDH